MAEQELWCRVCNEMKDASLFPAKGRRVEFACAECQARGYNDRGRKRQGQSRSEKAEEIGRRIAAIAEPRRPDKRSAALADVEEPPPICVGKMLISDLRCADELLAKGRIGPKKAKRVWDYVRSSVDDIYQGGCPKCQRLGQPCPDLEEVRARLAELPGVQSRRGETRLNA